MVGDVQPVNTGPGGFNPEPPQHPLGDHMPPWLIKAVVYILGVVTVYWVAIGLLSRVRDLLITLLLALFLSFAMEPAVDWMEQRGWKRGRATALVFVVTLIGGGLFAWVMVDLLVSEVSRLVADAPEYVREVTRWINRQFGTDITSDKIVAQLRQYQDDLSQIAANTGGRVLTLSAQVVALLFQMLTVGLFAFYLTADGPRARRAICSVLPEDKQRLVLSLWDLAIKKTGGYLYSRMLLATVAAVVSGIFFAIIGIPYAVALAVWLGILSQFVPVIGTYLAGALPVLIATIHSPTRGLIVVVFILVYQQVENYLLAPRVTARTMDIHPAVAFGAVIAGSGILGGVGALLALPAAAIIQAFISSFVHRHELVESDLFDPSPPTPSGATDELALAVEERSWVHRVTRRLEREHRRDRQGVEEDL